MNLLQHIRNQRVHQREKKPLRRNVFNQISSLVKQFGLEENFLNAVNTADDPLFGRKFEFEGVRVKESANFPLFTLATKEEYHLIKSIVAKYDNPYLQYAHSPEEILLSGTLFRYNSSISPEKLMHYHFETLLHYEYAKKHLTKLIEQASAIHSTRTKNCIPENTAMCPSELSELHRQIKKVENFIAKIENIEKNL